MGVTFGILSHTIQICRGIEKCSCPQYTAKPSTLTFSHYGVAKEFLQRFLGDKSVISEFRLLIAKECSTTPVYRLTDDQILTELAGLLVSSRLRVYECRPAPSQGEGRGVPTVRVREPHPAKPLIPRVGIAPLVKKTWIEIVLVDDEGSPVANARYRLELPDGSAKLGALNRNGHAFINGIDPGTCKVTFPDFDGQEWKTATI